MKKISKKTNLDKDRTNTFCKNKNKLKKNLSPTRIGLITSPFLEFQKNKNVVACDD
jgi:hypothetical protein